jgi:outer membrane biosynthesis protein TonB
MSRKYHGEDAFRRRPSAVTHSRRWRSQLEGLLRAGEAARRGLAEGLLAGVLLAVAVAGAVLIPRLLVGPPPGHELGVGAPSMTAPPVVLAPGLPGHTSKPTTAATAQGGATHGVVVPSASTSQAPARTHPVVTRPATQKPPQAQPQPSAQPQPETQPPPQAQSGVAASLSSGVTTCDGTFSGTGKDVVVPSGATCVLTDGTRVAHDLTVAAGGTLIDPAVTVGHDLVARSPAGISIHGDSIGHDLRIDGLTGSAAIRNQICGTTVGHDLVVAGGLASAGSFDIGGNCPDGGNTVGHDLVVVGNANAVAVAGNSVGHALRVEGVPQAKPKPKAPKPQHEPKPPKPEPPSPQHQPKPPKPPKPHDQPKPPKPPKQHGNGHGPKS